MKIVKPLLIAVAIAAASSAFAAGTAGSHTPSAAPVDQPDAVTSRFLAALNSQKGPGLGPCRRKRRGRCWWVRRTA